MGRYITPVKSTIVDLDGHIANVGDRGGLDVAIQDQITHIVDLYMHTHIETLTLTGGASIGDTSVEVTGVVATVAGHLLCFKEDGRASQIGILSVTGVGPWTLELDTPIDYAYTTGGFCGSSEHDLSIDGSVTPVVYHVQPPTGVKWDIVRIMFYIQDGVSMDDSKFGGIPGLTKGVVIRSTDGSTYNVFNIKTNGDFAQRAYDRAYGDKAPAGSYSMFCRRTFGGQSKNGVVIRLDGDSTDEFEAIVQDDLTGLEHFHIVVQGHIVDET